MWGMKAQTTDEPRFPVAPDPGEAPVEAAEPDDDLNSGVPGYVAGRANADVASRPMIQHKDADVP